MAIKAPAIQKNSSGPAEFRFQATLRAHPDPAKTCSHGLLAIPVEVSHELGNIQTVEGTVNDHPFRAKMKHTADGCVYLYVNSAMLKGAKASAGDKVKLAILGPEPEPTLPPDLRKAFESASEAERVWHELTLLGRLDWIRWIEGAKKPETRARRVTRTVEQLADGKRRACCVNVYEYMLCRVRHPD
jgi:hypothetical protein